MYIIDKKSKVFENHKLFLGGYAVLVALFIFFMIQCRLSFGMFEVFAICFVSIFCALNKSGEISLLIIDDRTTKDGISITLLGEKPIMFSTTVLCFVNYTVVLLTLAVCGELFVKELRASLWSNCGWMIIVYILLGLVAFFFGNYLEKNSASLFNSEPESLAKEHIAMQKKEKDREFHERNGLTWHEQKGGIEGFKAKHKLLMADVVFLWLTVIIVGIIVTKNSPDKTNYDRYDYEYYEDEEPHNYFN